ncbi:hypothetical protein MP638_006618 [Amoeboaphelidium occidentale]|nr:hypothetical protein MP638_006618 [Amoeboaphelidium occidentale]
MENLIPVINKLQDAFASVGLPGLDLPQIAVIGSQSAGKSSVLENIVGKDFLPRGSGIVTRRPLVLQLIPIKKGQQEYGVFLHQPEKKYYDFHRIRTEIEAETDRVTGNNKGISNIPINLKVYSPNVLNLTLIDLPGMTRVAVGDQPPDIEIQIREMLMQFVEKETCLILAVSPANTDLANSDALKLAKEVDPEGTRTIGVLTKLDLMDEGTNALDILQNKVYPLRHGFVGVVNRSQKDINNNKDVMAALESEKKWFDSHPVYSIIRNTSGTRFLQEKLKQTLIDHIQHHLPTLRSRLKDRLQEVENELAALCGHWDKSKGKFNPEALAAHEDDEYEKRRQLLNMAQVYASSLKKLLDGHDGDIDEDPFGVLGFICGGSGDADGQKFNLTGSVRIKYVFQEMFPKALIKVEGRILSSQMDAELRTIIHNSRGLRVGLFIPDALFEVVVKREIANLEKPALECVSLVTSEISMMVMKLLESKSSPLRAYPKLQSWFTKHTVSIIESFRDPCIEEVRRLIAMETSYINTSHPDFIAKDGMAKFMLDINSKGGAELARSVVMAQKEGFLVKLGGSHKTWKRRYFSLKDASLRFFDGQADKTPKGLFSLVDCHVYLPDTKEVIPALEYPQILPPDMEVECDENGSYRGKKNVFVIFHNAGSVLFRNHNYLVLAAENENELKQWVNILKNNISLAKDLARNDVQEFDDDAEEDQNLPPTPPSGKPDSAIKRKPVRPAPPPRSTKPDVGLSGSAASKSKRLSLFSDKVMTELPENFSSMQLYEASTQYSSSLVPEKGQVNASITGSDDTTIAMVRVLLHSYFVIVRKHIQDLVPKAIVHLMISRVKHDLLKCLTSKIMVTMKDTKDKSVEDPIKFMEENESTKEEKKQKIAMYKLVKEALHIIEAEVTSNLSQ